MSLELRPPPDTHSPSRLPHYLGALTLAQLLVLGLGVYQVFRPAPTDDGTARLRSVASKLKAAGAEDAAAGLYEDYLNRGGGDAKARANIAFSLGEIHFAAGRYPEALRWYYEAEALGEAVEGDSKGRIVASLERLGRTHAARAALAGSTALAPPDAQHAADDKVVASIGERKIYRSDLDRLLDDMPPEMAKTYGQKRDELLTRYVADELLFRKAEAAGYAKDPDVLRAQAQMLKQLAVSKFIEREVVGKMTFDPVDIKAFFEANKERYKGKDGKASAFEAARTQVERDYRGQKLQAAYQELIAKELQADDVHIFAEAPAK